MKTTHRLFRLLDLLQNQTIWTGADLANTLNVDVRTVRRDIDRLRDVGVMIESDRGVGGGYQIRATRRLPPLMLSDDEAVAVAVGLRAITYYDISNIEEMSLSALTKIEQFLPSAMKERIDALFSVMEFPTPRCDDIGVGIDELMLCSKSCRDHRTVSFMYQRRDGESSTRSVEPHYIVKRHRRWYLVAWDLERKDWRTFRLDRLSNLVSNKTKFQRRQLIGGKTATQYIDASFAQMNPERVNRFTVLGPVASVESTVSWARATFEAKSESETSVVVMESSIDQIIVIVSLLAAKFELKPEHLDDEVKDVLSTISNRL